MWLGPAVVALALGLFRIDVHQVWGDEAATWWAATLPLPDLARLAGHVDAVVLPYYLFMGGWIQVFGESPMALRAPSAMAMAASAGLVALLGRRLFDARVGVVAGLLFAVLPAVSYYAQEARPYAFTVAAALLATLLLVRAVDRPAPGRWVGYAASVVLLGYLQILALLLLTAHAAYVASIRRAGEDRAPRWWAAAAASAAGLVLPLLVLAATQRGQIGWIGPRTVGNLAGLPAILFGAAGAAGLVIGLALLAVGARDRRLLLLGAWAVVPPAVLFLASYAVPVLLPPVRALHAARLVPARRVRHRRGAGHPPARRGACRRRAGRTARVDRVRPSRPAAAGPRHRT